MKTRHIIYSLALIAVFNFYGCEENDPPYEQLTTSKEGTNIFLAKANTGLESLEIFPADEDEKTTTLGAGFGGLGVPKNDITITLRIDETALDSINAARILNGEAKYELFPENSYSIDKMSLSIQGGELYSDLSTLTYHPKVFNQEKAYILPISIADASGYPISKSAKTAIFLAPKGPVLKITETPYNKENWSVVDFSSEEDQGEGEVNGFAHNVLDDDPDTFWHSCWYACTAEETTAYPHWITINMKETLSLNGIIFYQRQSNTRAAKDVEVLISADNITWESLGDFQLEQSTSELKLEFENEVQAQYVKILIKTGWDGTDFAAMGEISPYFNEEAYVYE